MIHFNDIDNNPVIQVSYGTYIDKKNYAATIQFKIKFISPEYNGEYVYITTDDAGEQVMLYRFSLDDQFEFFELYTSEKEAHKLYTKIGMLFEILRNCTIEYNKFKRGGICSYKNSSK